MRSFTLFAPLPDADVKHDRPINQNDDDDDREDQPIVDADHPISRCFDSLRVILLRYAPVARRTPEEKPGEEVGESVWAPVTAVPAVAV